MKTFKALFTVILIAGFMTSASALIPLKDKAIDNKKELTTSLNNNISQNDIAWDLQRDTEVIAEIYVNMHGNPEIKAINGDKVYKSYVEKKLVKMKIDKDALLGKTFICKFKFRTN